MEIIIDTREQRQLEFDDRVSVVREKLEVGDYACRFKCGYQPPYIFERKSKSDLWGTLAPISKKAKKNGKEDPIERFSREFKLAVKLEIALILIIEGNKTSINRGFYNPYTRRRHYFDGKRMRTRLAHIESGVKAGFEEGMEIVFCKDRNKMAEYIVDFYINLEKKYKKNGII